MSELIHFSMQRRIKIKVEAPKRPQAETDAELEALLPALPDRAFKGEL
jgi:hypothetical protein